jgi:hypothetical protein
MGGLLALSGSRDRAHRTVCSAAALDEFFSLLLSARFGSADALLDILARVRLDVYIDYEHVRTRNNPSDQGQSMTCYAHATATVLHMALLRIVGREEGYPNGYVACFAKGM